MLCPQPMSISGEKEKDYINSMVDNVNSGS